MPGGCGEALGIRQRMRLPLCEDGAVLLPSELCVWGCRARAFWLRGGRSWVCLRSMSPPAWLPRQPAPVPPLAQPRAVFAACSCVPGSLHPAGGGDGRHGPGDQHERDRGAGRGPEQAGEGGGEWRCRSSPVGTARGSGGVGRCAQVSVWGGRRAKRAPVQGAGVLQATTWVGSEWGLPLWGKRSWHELCVSPGRGSGNASPAVLRVWEHGEQPQHGYHRSCQG